MKAMVVLAVLALSAGLSSSTHDGFESAITMRLLNIVEGFLWVQLANINYRLTYEWCILDKDRDGQTSYRFLSTPDTAIDLTEPMSPTTEWARSPPSEEIRVGMVMVVRSPNILMGSTTLDFKGEFETVVILAPTTDEDTRQFSQSLKKVVTSLRSGENGREKILLNLPSPVVDQTIDFSGGPTLKAVTSDGKTKVMFGSRTNQDSIMLRYLSSVETIVVTLNLKAPARWWISENLLWKDLTKVIENAQTDLPKDDDDTQDIIYIVESAFETTQKIRRDFPEAFHRDYALPNTLRLAHRPCVAQASLRTSVLGIIGLLRMFFANLYHS